MIVEVGQGVEVGPRENMGCDVLVDPGIFVSARSGRKVFIRITSRHKPVTTISKTRIHFQGDFFFDD